MAGRQFANVGDMSFREASAELEGIVRELEGGNLELEDSLEAYGRGVELLKDLRARISAAEARVNELLESSGGQCEVTDTTSAPSTAFIDE